MRTHLASLVEEFRLHAGETAVVAHRGNRRYRTTYGELAQITGRFAAELDRRNIAPGDRVVLWGANSAEWIGAFFGCLLRGVLAVPLDFAGSPDFAARIVQDVSPKLIVGDHSLIQSLVQHLENFDVPWLTLYNLIAQLPAEPNFAVSPSVTKDAAFQIVFTSGTTSDPKGIVHTHANVLSSVRPIEHEMHKYQKYERWVHPLRFLHTLPLSHVFGQFMGLWLPPLLAAEVHFADQFEARRLTDLIRHERISVLVAVPRILQLLRTHLLSRFPDLASLIEHAAGSSQPSLKRVPGVWWRFRKIHSALGWKFWAVISGGAALPAEIEHFWNRIGIALIQGYGMTETTALVTVNHPFQIAEGTIGRTLPGREVKLSEDGEILVRGDMLANATWQNGAMRKREGEWLSTGDIGEKNASGELVFLGRKGDVIVTGSGMNIHPADLEEAMKHQSGIRDCVVVPCGFPSGIEPVAVVLSAGTDAELQSAVRAANRELADFQQIRRALKWPDPAFPFTSTGKLLRRKVNEWVCQNFQAQHMSGQPTTGQLPRRDIVLELIASVTGESIANPSDTMRLTEDLHLDSLGRVELQSALEQRLDLELADDAIASTETLGELRTIVARQAAHIGRDSEQDIAADSRQPASTSESLPLPSAETASAQPSEPTAAPVIASTQSEEAASSVPHRHLTKAEKDQRALTSDRFYPHWPWSWPIRLARLVFREAIIRPLVWFLGAPRVILPKSPIPGGPMIIVSNHVASIDGSIVLYSLPFKIRRQIAIAMAGELLLDFKRARNQGNWLFNLSGPIQYYLVTALFNVFPLPRMHGYRRSFQHAGEAMDRGFNVLVFPEGAVSETAETRPFRQGIGLLVRESRVPVLPVGLRGFSEMRKSGWFRSGLLEIRIGEPIPFDDAIEPAALTARLEAAVHDLLS
ncbi:AMP-binding protein [Acidicapsa dinghuensis]|uniref:AMP-binding protein n=1 Tax=Acidicapsa dinghuensis TaxID=2218256 RepID=A0ABW1EEQ8_9BACT|nr:AMP-binding protein [Acidicapsa dinghuensis]